MENSSGLENHTSDGPGNYSSDGLGNYTSDGLGNYTFDASPDFMFGATGQQDVLMDFEFDTIAVPGSDDMLAAMQAIQNPAWFGNMLMPGSVDCLSPSHVLVLTSYSYRFSWPSEEPMQDHGGTVGNGTIANNYQNFQVQPTEVMLR
jgi:hypothetical protein